LVLDDGHHRFSLARFFIGPAKVVLAGLAAAARRQTPACDWQAAPYTQESAGKVKEWWAANRELCESGRMPTTMGRIISEVRKVLRPEGIVLTSAANIQVQVLQELAFSQPQDGWAQPSYGVVALLALDHRGSLFVDRDSFAVLQNRDVIEGIAIDDQKIC
jgi:hypothetical protein